MPGGTTFADPKPLRLKAEARTAAPRARTPGKSPCRRPHFCLAKGGVWVGLRGSAAGVTRGKAMKRLLPPVAACLLILTGALLAAQSLISPEMVRKRLVDEFAAWTGWSVTVGGEASVAFFPVPSFKVTGITVSSPAGGPALAEIPEVRGKFKLLALLVGRIEAREIQLAAPRFNLAVDAGGRNNWEIGEGLAKLATTGRGTPSAEAAANAVRPGGVAIADGVFRFSDARTGADTTANEIDLAIYWRSLRDSVSATGAFTWGGERLEAMGSFDAPQSYFTGGVSPLRFALGSPLLHMVFNGRASSLNGLQLDGEVNANTPSLRRLISWGGYPLPSGATLGPASIKTQARWLGTTLAFTATTLEVDGNQARGALNLVTGAERPALDGTLAFETADLSPYAESALAHLNSNGSWQQAPAEIRSLSAIDLDLRLSTRRLVLGGAQFGGADLNVNLARGRLTLNLADLSAYAGRLQGTLKAHCVEGRLIAEGHLAFDSVPVRPFLSDFVGLASFDGFASGSLVMTGQGSEWGAVVRGATGSGTMNVIDASISGLDLGRLSTALFQVATGARRDAVATFSSVKADFTVSEAGVRATALTAAGRGYVVNLDGQASLLSPAIAAKGTLSLARAAGETQPALEVPFLVNGTWLQPAVAPDFERLRRRTTGELRVPAPVLR